MALVWQDSRRSALTGWDQEQRRRRSAEAGFDGHLIEPVDPDALAELLAAAGPPR